jgi:hypothetical protein
MAQQPSGKLAPTDAATRAQDATIQERCQRKDFSPYMPQSTTRSTSNAISHQQEHSEPSEHQPCKHGVKSSLRGEPDLTADLPHAEFGNATKPRMGVFPLVEHVVYMWRSQTYRFSVLHLCTTAKS